MSYENPWIYNGTVFDSGDIQDNYGFIYRITNTTNGYDYVGRKYFTTVKKRPPLKGKKNKRRETVETDWKEYWGSSPRLQEDINKLGKDKFTREIIHLCKSRGETNYMEAYYQFTEGVLLREDNYNGIIQIKLGKNSVKDVKFTK
jgi:Putative endonuclease segE, GIY-YIG domain